MHRNRGSFGRNCTETMSCRWGTELWDQFDNLEKHTHWGIEFVERYTKFVKERSEIEISYAKQIRNLSKKYQPKKNSREEDEYKYTSCRAFLMTLNELNDYAGQHEVIAENLTTHIICELTRYIQELKAERKSHFHDGRRAQQHIENSWKQLESSKRRFERDCKEADRAQQYFDKIDADINVTKADVEKRCSLKARQQAQLKHQVAEDSKNEYLTYLQKFNKEQNEHYYSLIPHIFQKIQEMEEKRIEKVGESMKTYAEVNRKVLPIVSKCLDGMTNAAASIEPTMDTKQVVESFKSGFEPPGDVEVEDYSLSMRRTVSESSYLNSRGEGKPSRSNSRGKLWPFKRNKGSGPEDCSHLPPEQRRKKLQAKINDINKELQKEVDQRDALTKMKDVYVRNPHMGDPNSVDPRLEEIGQDIDKLELDSRKYEAWLLEVETRLAEKSDPHRRQSGLYDSNATTPVNNNCAPVNRESPDGSYTEDHSTEHHLKSRSTDFDDDFDDEDPLPTIGTCKSLYPFEGQNEGTISMAEGELLYVIEEDKGDGWTRVRRNEDEEGYVPTSYIKVFFDTNAKGAMTYI
ncbi:formin-binding protein 1-like isoform X6 [Oncorhynchus keta]|uniref:formin-binding protein 1-like isoform X6 n=1 Tax=Oncorhynchus keta TaxID=8018 RepID=UPI0011308DC0|nr:formin-binding protein 1-like isoform X4 [Oncorhynchus nerka]XP_035591308.1 formin-binding protein 1-like isoform X6 [Oncorhynchus keta]XP_046206027.1 formin-binding protein 1-like isoform X6 [Oncorhynchus gorbuscha]